MKTLSCFCPPETTAKLRCPERGFYTILRFTADEECALPDLTARDPDDTLILVEINLCRYAAAPLSERALGGIDGLFQALAGYDCALIVRFLYDWCGRNIITEPKSIEVILGHMEQLEPVIRKHEGIICLLQGLFIGNWGEMHGSRFLRGDHLKKLYAVLSRVTGNRIPIAVRTPALWCAVTGATLTPDVVQGTLPGLFNDGMLGNVSEYGTYSADPSERERELMLQKTLAKTVPYGGEVVGTEPQSDAKRAMAALEKTCVSYLNRLYDEKTLDKWKNSVISDGSIRNGMTYFDYAETHLGYRFVIRGVSLRLSPLSGRLTAKIKIENIGFAPIYHDTAAELVFVSDDRRFVFPMDGSLSGVSRESGAKCLAVKQASLRESLGSGDYDIYFRIKSLKYNVTIPTANQGCGESGCLIGRYTGK